MEDAPLISVSAYTGENIDLLRKTLLDMAETCEEPDHEKALARLPIDRVFSVAGHGTVITGTLVEGCIKKATSLCSTPP